MIPDLLEKKRELVDEIRKLIEYKEYLTKDIEGLIKDQKDHKDSLMTVRQ